jgi:hypothetical protein
MLHAIDVTTIDASKLIETFSTMRGLFVVLILSLGAIGEQCALSQAPTPKETRPRISKLKRRW